MVPMVVGGGGAVRPAGGSAHPHPLAAQMRHDFSQQEPGTRNQEPGTRNWSYIREKKLNVIRILDEIIRKIKDFNY